MVERLTQALFRQALILSELRKYIGALSVEVNHLKAAWDFHAALLALAPGCICLAVWF